MNDDANTDPLLVSSMRRWPTGEVRHIPGNGIGMSGTHSAAFLAEYDQALAEAYRRGHGDGYALASQDIADEQERHARERAAEELRAAAKDVAWPTVNAMFFRRVLRARADALAAEAAS